MVAPSVNAPVPAAETAADKPKQGEPRTEPPKRDGTIELVVEAKESILESETPLTQVMSNSGEDAETKPAGGTFSSVPTEANYAGTQRHSIN